MSDNNKDGELSKVKDFDTSSLGPVKMNKQFVEELISVMKDQFSSLKQGFLDLQTSVASDVKQLVSKVDEASEIATSAKATADANVRALDDLKSKMTTEIKNLKTDLLQIRNEWNTVNADNKEIKLKNVLLETECEELKRQVNSVEMYSRRDNIVFYGITETQNETNDQCLVAARNFMINKLCVPENKANSFAIIRCHRLKHRGRNRPIIVRFKDFHDREYVWGQLSNLPKNNGFFISEDFPKSVAFNRKKMLPIFNRARRTLGKTETSLKGDVMTISGNRYTVKNINTLKGDLHPKCFSRKQSNDVVVFGGSFSEYEPFSNWWKFPVQYEGTTFPTLEHAYMHTKCMVNGNVTAAAAVLQCAEQYQAKEIGDKVKVTENWNFVRRETVMKSLITLKFSPGSALGQELLNTGNKFMAESGRDNYYSCGLSFTNKNILDRKAHTGKNNLGAFLMERRDSLR